MDPVFFKHIEVNPASINLNFSENTDQFIFQFLCCPVFATIRTPSREDDFISHGNEENGTHENNENSEAYCHTSMPIT